MDELDKKYTADIATNIRSIMNEISDVCRKHDDGGEVMSALLTIISAAIYKNRGNVIDSYNEIDGFAKIMKDGAIKYFEDNE